MEFTVFLPCRAGSQRVKDKNTRKFANYKMGLFELKIRDLIKIKSINNIVVSTNEIKIINYLKEKKFQKVRIDCRPDNLCSSKTTTDKLIKYVPKVIKSGHVLWTHVTSPFFDNNEYDKSIRIYKKKIHKGFDSLMSVSPINKFIWDSKKPINYDYNKIKWPFTQKIKTLYEVNSAIFINSIENYKRLDNRIGKKPFFHEVEDFKKIDVDTYSDFEIAERIYKKYF
jgi:CMP-N-acetylneuraminic acid synthetase